MHHQPAFRGTVMPTLNAKMNKINASSNSDLMEMLSAIDISVPLRSEGRTTKNCEQWSICRWLSTIPNLEFPLMVRHQDKPDFYLKSGAEEYGLRGGPGCLDREQGFISGLLIRVNDHAAACLCGWSK